MTVNKDKTFRLSLLLTGSEGETLQLQADTMNEMIDKIISFTTASSFEIDHYTTKGNEDYLNSGWFYKEKQ